MITDKEITIELIMQESPGLHKKLVDSGELKTLSDEDLMHLYASSSTELLTDISDIPDDEMPPVNMDVIKSVMKEAKAYNETQKQTKVTFSVALKRVAMVACIIIVFGIGFCVMFDSTVSEFEFQDKTSQETTDYAIRVRTDAKSTDDIHHKDLVQQIRELLSKEFLSCDGSYSCILFPVYGYGDMVQLVLRNKGNGRSVSRNIKLTTRTEVYANFSKIVPEMIKEISN